MQKDLTTIYAWSIRNELLFNFSKCKMLQIGRKTDFRYQLGPQELEWVSCEKDLGVWIPTNLKTGMQCQTIYNRASDLLGMLRRLFSHFTRDTFPVIMNTYIPGFSENPPRAVKRKIPFHETIFWNQITAHPNKRPWAIIQK